MAFLGASNIKSNHFPLVGDRKDIQPHKIVEWPGIELAACRVESHRLNRYTTTQAIYNSNDIWHINEHTLTYSLCMFVLVWMTLWAGRPPWCVTSHMSGMGSDYRPKCNDAVWLILCRWMHVSVAGESVRSLVNTRHT